MEARLLHYYPDTSSENVLNVLRRETLTVIRPILIIQKVHQSSSLHLFGAGVDSRAEYFKTNVSAK